MEWYFLKDTKLGVGKQHVAIGIIIYKAIVNYIELAALHLQPDTRFHQEVKSKKLHIMSNQRIKE